MNQLELYLYDDDTARRWQPFSLTRPVGELMLGAFTFRARAEHLTGVRCSGHISSAHLFGFADHDAIAVIDPATIPSDRTRLFLSSRFVADWPGFQLPGGGAVLHAAGTIVGCLVPSGSATPDASWFTAPEALSGFTDIEVAGRVIAHVWDLIAANPDQVTLDFEATRPGATPPPIAAAGGAPGASDVSEATRELPAFDGIAYRDGMLRLGSGAEIEPNVVLDFSNGPIRLDDGARIRAFTRLAGPAYVGRDSTLLGGPYDAVTIGPVCKVHGELEESIVLGYSNKAHDGFLGHAYLGRWVNLGAMTTNSDLKNNYGTIRMSTPDGEVDTGLIKLGCLLGDHVKTGIGALLNTGTIIGAGSNLFGTAMPPKHVPPFSWGSGSELVAYDVERFVGVARTVMGRRGLEMDGATEDMLRAAWRIGREGVAS